MSLWRHRGMKCWEELDRPSLDIMQFYIDTQWEMVEPVSMLASAHAYILRGDRSHLTHAEWDTVLYILELAMRGLDTTI